MNKSAAASSEPSTAPTIDLKNQWLAGVLAWLIPGAGHMYQGRIAKGVLFFVCIVGTFFNGLYLGGGHVVYASWRPNDKRLHYICQVGVGLPALPALVQARAVQPPWPKSPWWDGFMAPPMLPGEIVPRERAVEGQSHSVDGFRLAEQWRADARDAANLSERYVVNQFDEKSAWEEDAHQYFQIGELYTMLAGLLNLLVIFDAAFGPLWVHGPPQLRPPDESQPSGAHP